VAVNWWYVTGSKGKKANRNAQRLALHLLAHLKKNELVRPGDRVAVAVSGGADSVALLLLLLDLRDKLGIVISAVHFNHKLRGRVSDADELFVKQLAAKHGLEFHSSSLHVANKAKKESANLEDAARRARYDYLRFLAESGACTRVAVAHSADDQAETVLAHLLRGTGITGLGGIHPVAGPVVRPLLDVRRSELRAYLRSRKQTWREDLTNRDTRRMRARIRHKLLPLLEKHFQPEIVRHLVTLANLAREDEAFLDAIAERRVKLLFQHRGGQARIAVEDLFKPWMEKNFKTETADGTEYGEGTNALALSKRIVRQMVLQVKPRAGQLGARHVEAVLELARRGQSGGALSLPGGVEVRRERDTLVFCGIENVGVLDIRGAAREFERSIDLVNATELVRVPELGCAFRFTMIDWPPKRGETNKQGTVLDRHRLRAPLVLRNWRPGDRLCPVGHRNAHKLKRLLNEKRINRWERDGWPVLTSGGVLAWARGFHVAAEFAADERTRSGMVIAEEQL
jgi:tRNA(Ile)-lysidine synthase